MTNDEPREAQRFPEKVMTPIGTLQELRARIADLEADRERLTGERDTANRKANAAQTLNINQAMMIREYEAVIKSNKKCNDDMERDLLAAVADRARLTAERDKLQAFEDWVHAYLDGKGVPPHPPGSHESPGCRVVDRMVWVWAEIERLRQAVGNPWRKVACQRGDGSKTGRFNVARRKGEFKGSDGKMRPLWEHHGAGDFTEEEADDHVARLNAELAQ